MKTKSFILVSVAVFAALVGGFLYVALSGGGDERRLGAALPTTAGNRYALEIGGVNVGFLKSFSGCGVSADVNIGEKGVKHAGAANYVPCKIRFGSGMGAPLYSWITDVLAGKAASKDVSIIQTDSTLKSIAQLNLINAALTRFTVPDLDAANSDVLYFEATLVPAAVQKAKAPGTVSGGVTPTSKVIGGANFRFVGPGGQAVAKIESWSFDVKGGAAELGNLTLDVGEPATEFDTWLDELMKGSPTQKDLSIEILDATLKEVLIGFNFSGVGLAAGDLMAAGSEAVSRRQFTIYVNGASIKFNPRVIG